MKLLFLISSLSDLSKHSLYSDFIIELHSHGHEVRVVSPRQINQEEGLYIENGIPVVRFITDQLTGNKSFIKKGIAYLKLVYQYPKAVNKFFKNEKFNFIYANSLPLEIGIVIYYLKKKYKAKSYVMLCDYLWQDLVSLNVLKKWNPIILYYRLLERILFKSADYIGALSEGYIDFAKKYYQFIENKSTAVILPWSFEETVFGGKDELLKNMGLQGKFLAIYGGNVGVAQDINNVINLAYACKGIIDIVFLVVGKGAQFEMIKKKVKSEQLMNIRFLDFMPKDKYLRLIHACDIGLISLNEKLGAPNFPSKASSLFSMSIPVVAAIDYITDFGQFLEQNNVGLCSYSGDTESFKNNVLKLYHSTELKEEMGKNANKFYHENMTVSQAYNTFMKQINGNLEYKIKLVDFSDSVIQDKIVKLQNIVYADRGGVFTSKSLVFWYLENQIGKVISFNAFYGDEIVAHYACIPIQMMIDGKVSTGLLDMATVTHPEHRGKGLFKKLAQTTYAFAKENGFEFVVGVANANSFPGYMKYFDFQFISKLDVKWGWGPILLPQKTFSGYWTKESLDWRLGKPVYSVKGQYAYGKYGNYPLIQPIMGVFPAQLLDSLSVSHQKPLFKPLNLYVGLGADLSKGHYFNFPKFVKHSPFNLIFLDLTDGKFPKINKDNVVYQLIDFDVA